MFLVSKCPKNLLEKNDASKRLGCGRDKFDKDQYMCTPNAEKTSLVEFCHKGIMGIKEKDTCLEVDKNASLLRWNCTEFKTGCPKSHYYNDEIYKYPACQNINPVKKCYVEHPSCTPIHIAENSDNIPKDDPNIAVVLSIVSVLVIVLVLVLVVGLSVWLLKKKQQKQETETQSLSNNNSERTTNHDEIKTQPLSDVSPEPTGNHEDTERTGMSVFSWEDQHFFERASRPLKPIIPPKTNYHTRKMPFNLDRVHASSIKKAHLFIPKEFIVKIRKTKRKDQELISEESSIWKVVTCSKIQDYSFSESSKELLGVATNENIVPDEEDHLLKTPETGTLTSQSLQEVPDNVEKYLISDPNVRAFGVWNISNFKVFVNYTANENEIRNTKIKLIKLNPFFFGKYKLEIEAFLESPIRELDDSAPTDLQIIPVITDRRNFEIPLLNLKKTTFTTTRIHQHENSSGEETDLLQPKDDELCLSERKTQDDFGTSKACCLAPDKYDTTFYKSENRKMYDGLSDHQVDLNKKGTDFFYSNGIMLSSEFYVKGIYNERNTDSVFIVLDAVGNVPNPFVSVSLVCLRPQRGQQNHVNAVGIIYSTPVDNLYTTETSSEKENTTSGANKSTDTKVFGNRR